MQTLSVWCRWLPDGRYQKGPMLSGWPGSALLGERIAEVFTGGHDCVMLENHGVVVGGWDFQEAFRRFEMLEFVAKTIVKASALGEVRYLSDAELSIGVKPVTAMETFAAGEASSEERLLRTERCDFIRRGYQQRLRTSAAGSFSVRVDEESFLITGELVDRATVTPDQLVLVRGGRCEAGGRPSRAHLLHAPI